MAVKYDLFKDARVKVVSADFDLNEVYSHAHDWLDWKKYDIIEKNYKEYRRPKGREIKIKWEATRDIDEYSRFEIDVQWHMIGVRDIKVPLPNGKENKIQHGEINIYITAYLVLDYHDRWEEGVFLKFLKSFFEKYMYAGTVQVMKTELWKEGWDFYNEMKSFLNLFKYKIVLT